MFVKRRRAAYRPIVESLEDRTLPSSAPAVLGLAPADPATTAQISAAYGQVPMSFEVNEGQTDSSVNFLAHGAGYTLFLTPGGSTLSLQQPSTGAAQDNVQMQLAGANPNPTAAGVNLLANQSNYLVGNDPSQWQTDIPNYGEVEYQNVYQGVNLVYYGNNSQLEYDFVVAPGANPNVISMAFQGTQGLSLDAQGNLVLQTSGGELVEQAPVLYQMIGGVRHDVSGNFVLQGNGQVGFSVGAYDASQPLTIDPVLVYSTYFGGGGDQGWDVAVNKAGDAYIVGATMSTHLPVLHDIQGPDTHGGQYIFVTEFNPTGNALVFSTYFGGTSQGPMSTGAVNRGFGIALDSTGDIYITGDTVSTNFPTKSPFQLHNGDDPGEQLTENAFVTKLGPNGASIIFSTYLGGTGTDSGRSIAVDSLGNATVVGVTSPTLGFAEDFPTPNGFQTIYGGGDSDAFIARFSPTGAIVYSSYLGGSGADGAGADPQAIGGGDFVALDGAGNAYVTGFTTGGFPTLNAEQSTYGGGDFDAFVAEVSPAGAELFATYLGGDNIDIAHGIAVDAFGNIYVTGQTESDNFPGPLTYQNFYNGGPDNAFITKLSPNGASIDWSTYLGGTGETIANAIAVDPLGDIYITGTTTSYGNFLGIGDFPTTPDALTLPLDLDDTPQIFVTEMDTNGSTLIYSTLIGDTDAGLNSDISTGIALDPAGSIYVTGYTESDMFPTLHPYEKNLPGGTGDSSAFLLKLGEQTVTHFQVQFVTPPVTAGTPTEVTVTAEDASGAAVTDYQGTIHFLSSDQAAGLPADYTFTAADDGTQTFNVTLQTAGPQSVTVFDVVAPTTTGSATTTVNPANVNGFLVTGFPSSILSGVAHTFTVTAVDAYGNRVTNYTGTVQFSSSAGSASFSPVSYAFKAIDKGQHTFTATLNARGPQSLVVNDSSNNSIAGAENNIVVSPTTHFSITVAPGTTFTAGTPFTVTVTALDARGLTDTDYAGTVAFSSTDKQVSPSSGLPANSGLTNGVMQFTVTLDTAGSQTITVSDASTSTITGKATFLVVANTAFKFLVSGYPATTIINAIHPFTITAADQWGNPTSYTGPVTFSSTDGAIVFSPPTYTFVPADKGKHVINAVFKTRGSQSLTVNGGGFTGTENDILVSPATHLTAVGSTTKPTAGVPFMVTITARDASNLVDTAFLDNVHVSTTDKAATATVGDLPADHTFGSGDAGVFTFPITLDTAGTQTITFTDTTRKTVVGTLVVTVGRGTVSALVITGYPADALENVAHTFQVTAVDAGGNRISTYAGTVNFTGNVQGLPASYHFTAADAGQHTFTGASFTQSGSQPLNVTDGSANGSDTVTVYALNAGIAGPSLAVPGQPLSYTFTASTTPTLPDNILFTYHILFGGVSEVIKGPNGLTVPFTFTGVGTPTISLTAVDASGFSSSPTSLNVTVTTTAIETDPAHAAQTDLVIGGGTGNNTILLQPANAAGTEILVSVNGASQGTFLRTAHIIVYGQGGNDTIEEMTAKIAGNTVFITIPAVLDGGAGNDTIIAAGSSAPNILLGLNGKDVLIGGTGRNILIGGAGASTLYGRGQDDILIPGTTIYDTNLVALFDLMDEWNSGTAYATRVGHLLGTIAGGLNGTIFLDSATVQRITASDVMYGEGGSDWFFFTSKGTVVDQIKEKTPSDIITPL